MLLSVLVASIVIVLLAGLLALGIITWQSVPPTELVTDSYILTVGNGVEEFFTTDPVGYPFFKIGSERAITYSYRIPASSPTDPSLPILVTLPSNATNLVGQVLFSSFSLPVGETSLNIVQYDANTAAMRYEPSGTYATGGELVAAWTLLYTVVYTFAPP